MDRLFYCAPLGVSLLLELMSREMFSASPKPRNYLAYFTRLIASLCVVLSISAIAVSEAKAKATIVAIVNGEPITNFELEDRVKFIQLVTNIEDSADGQKNLRRDALQGLIEDRIKIQEAEKYIPDGRTQARAAAQNFAEQNFARDGQNAAEFLSQQDINIDTVITKYVADILWSNTLRLQFSRQFEALDKNAAKELERIEKKFAEPQLKFSEIILLPTPQRPLQQTEAIATQMVQALNEGASFSGIAQQYSAAGSAQRGGNVGWVFTDRIPDKLRLPLEAAEIGDIVGPITLNSQIYIFKREGYREQGLLDPKATIVTLARIVELLPVTLENEERETRAQTLIDETAGINSCEQALALHAEKGAELPGLLENLALSDLSPQLQREIIALDINTPSRPINFAEGLVVFMVCARALPELDLPSLDSLKQRELERIMTSLSGRFLLRLQRNARIEIKL